MFKSLTQGLAKLVSRSNKPGMFGLGFDAAGSGRRLKHFSASRAHVNTHVSVSGADLNARARHLVRNNGYAANAAESFAANIVGEGIKPSSGIQRAKLKKDLQASWLAWTDEADFEGITDFYGIQRRIAREVFITGEAFVRVSVSSGRLQLQLLPAELIPLSKTEVSKQGTQIRQGIEFDARGRRIAYHALTSHPGDVTANADKLARETVRIPARDVMHIFDPIDAGQIRGYTRFASVMAKLFLLDQYDDAELDRKKVAAMFAGFITKPGLDETAYDPVVGDLKAQDDDIGQIDLEPGTLQFLKEGEDIRFSDPADVGGAYEAFQYRTLLAVTSGLGMPYANVTSDMLKANYSNTRAALLEFRRRASAFQHAVLVYQFCRPVWQRWMDLEVLSGRLKIRDYETKRATYTSASWLPPRWEWVDPVKDIRAEIDAMQAGIKSRSQAISERGYDAETLDAEIAADRKREAELGLNFDVKAEPQALQAKPKQEGTDLD